MRQQVSEVVGLVYKGVEGLGVRVCYFVKELGFKMILVGIFGFVCF